MKKYIFLFILFRTTLFYSQINPNFLWVTPVGGLNADAATASVTDSLGNVYVTGYFSGTADFDPSPAAYNITSFGSNDIFVAKYGLWGNFIWAFRVGGFSNDRAYDIAIDKLGCIYLGGDFAATCNFNPGAGPAVNLTSAGGTDVFLAKYSNSGGLIWAKKIGAASYDNISTIAIDGQANLYYTGYVAGIVDFDPSPATYTLSGGSQSAYFSKLDSAGNFNWANLITFSTWGGGTGIEATKNGSVYICGYGYGTGDFDPGPGSYTIAGAGNTDIFMAKYTTAGTLAWAGMSGSPFADQALNIALDTAGNIGLTGYFTSNVDFDFGPGTFTVVSNGGSEDMFIAKYYPNGNLNWVKGMGHASNGERGLSAAFDKQSNFYVTGPLNYSIDFDPSPATAILSSQGSTDAYFAKYNITGDYVWAKRLGGFAAEIGNHITIDDSTNIFVTGNFDGTTDFDASAAMYYLNGNFTDGYVTKYSECNIPSRPVINAFPTANICNGVYATTLSISAASLNTATSWQWYQGACGMNPVGNGTQLAVSPTVTTTYFVRGEGGCSGVSMMCSSVTIFIGTQPTVSIAGSNTACAGATLNLLASGANTYTWSNAYNSPGISVTPTITTTFSVIGMSTSGCTNTAFQTITVQALPVLTVVASPTVVCPGQTATLNVSGAVNYTWNPLGSNNSSVTVIPYPPASYSVIGSNAFGCSANAILSVSVYPLPPVGIVPNSSICPGATASLSAFGAGSYSWSTGSNSFTTAITQTATTNYTVYGTNTVTGCSNSATTQVQLYPVPPIYIGGTATTCIGGNVNLIGSGVSTYTWSNGFIYYSINVSPTVNTTYTLTGTSAQGCTNTTVKTVTVYPSPTLTISSNSNSVCAGGNVTLTSAGANTYTWVPGCQTSVCVVSPAVSTIFILNAQSVYGCTATAQLSITALPLPTVAITSPATLVCPGEATALYASPAGSYSWSNGQSTGSVLVSPITNTVYSVIVTDNNGCSNFASQQVNLLSLPLVTVTASSESVCTNGSVMLVANGAITYTWNNNSNNNPIIQSIVANSTFSVIGEDANGCKNTASLNVFVQNGPMLTVAASPSAICLGDSITLSAAGANSYTWQPGNLSGNNITVFPVSNITYSVAGTGTDVCDGLATISVIVDPCTGFKEQQAERNIFKIYPNPNSGVFTVYLSGNIKEGKIEIQNSLGQILHVSELVKQENYIDVQQLPAGLYFVHFSDRGKITAVSKIIKE